MTKNFFSKASAVIALLLVSSLAHADLVISDAIVREGPPTARMLAGFFNVENNSTKQLTITGASSADFEKVEMHMTYMDKGMMHMKAVPIMKIAPGQVVQFKPGGFHLMLIGPKHRVKQGDQITIVLHTQQKNTSFVAKVVRQAGIMH